MIEEQCIIGGRGAEMSRVFRICRYGACTSGHTAVSCCHSLGGWPQVSPSETAVRCYRCPEGRSPVSTAE